MTDLEIKLQKELNDEQYNAAIHMEGPAAIIAGAGSGKTHTLISRIEHLVDSGVSPERIVTSIPWASPCFASVPSTSSAS